MYCKFRADSSNNFADLKEKKDGLSIAPPPMLRGFNRWNKRSVQGIKKMIKNSYISKSNYGWNMIGMPFESELLTFL